MTTSRGPGGGWGGLRRMESLTSMKAMSQRVVRKTRRVVTGQMMTSSSTESLSGVGQVETSKDSPLLFSSY